MADITELIARLRADAAEYGERDPTEAADALTAQAHKLQLADERIAGDERVINSQRGIIYARDRTIKEQAATIAEQGRELEAMHTENERLRGIVPEVLEKLNDDLCAENEALRADAERWRFAISPGVDQSMRWLDVYEYWNGEDDFTAAVDAALAGKAVES